MKNRAVLAGIVIAACALVGFRQADQSTPESTVKAFAAAVQAVDFKAASKLVKGGKPDANYSELIASFKSMPFKLEVIDLKADVQGNRATATYKLRLTTGTDTSRPDLADSVRLERVAGAWLILPVAGPGDSSELGAFASMLAADMMSVFQRANQSAKAAACLSNVKQLAMAFMMLAADNDDVFRVQANSWKQAIAPYIKNERLLHCPADKSGTVSYSVNPYVLGKSQSSMQFVSETVLIYEGAKMKLNFRHAGKAAVAFTDGHAKLTTVQEAKKLRWKP